MDLTICAWNESTSAWEVIDRESGVEKYGEPVTDLVRGYSPPATDFGGEPGEEYMIQLRDEHDQVVEERQFCAE